MAYETGGLKCQMWGDYRARPFLWCYLQFSSSTKFTILTSLTSENYKLRYLCNPWDDFDHLNGHYYIFKHPRHVWHSFRTVEGQGQKPNSTTKQKCTKKWVPKFRKCTNIFHISWHSLSRALTWIHNISLYFIPLFEKNTTFLVNTSRFSRSC